MNRAQGGSGKTTYNLTCARCHGSDGGGNTQADQFFHTNIPRLNSAAVQSKSDAELKETIAKGIRAMPPVEIEESGFRHHLAPARCGRGDCLRAYAEEVVVQVSQPKER